MNEHKESSQKGKYQGAFWALAVGAQGGLVIALPVVVALALGYWLDSQFGTLPWITLVLTLIGAVAGPIVIYRWVTKVVRRRTKGKKDEENNP
ncbi:MAG: AtpZ/AtpI family protein [Chloroflexota bacterium]|nr:AtpZ/AtpI family protein [Chloroflexota bacterium]